MKRLDIVTPCYNEEECVLLFYNEVERVMLDMPGYTYTIIFINDGSTDATLHQIKDLAKTYGSDKIKYISFSRNFGKEAAIYAGLKASTGDFTALMDCDLQHPPAMLPRMLSVLDRKEADVCGAKRVNRNGEPKLRSLFSKWFYRLINKLSNVKLEPNVSDFRVMTRDVVKAIISLPERERFTKGIFSWVGFRTEWINYENVERAAGTTTWSFIKLFMYALSGITAFSTAPLRLASVLGFVVVAGGFGYGIFTLLSVLIRGVRTSGFATVIILMLFLSGIIIILLGIIGEYLSRIYYEIKARPVYISNETNIRHEIFDNAEDEENLQ